MIHVLFAVLAGYLLGLLSSLEFMRHALARAMRNGRMFIRQGETWKPYDPTRGKS